MRSLRTAGGDLAQGSMLAGFVGGLDALRAVGLVSEEEHEDWQNRMLDALGVERPDPDLPPGTGSARMLFVGDPDAPPPPLPQPAGSLVRVVVAPGVSWEYAGGRFQVLSVEVYEHQVGVAWREHPLADPEIVHPEALRAAERNVEGLPEPERTHRLNRVRQRLAAPTMPIDSLTDDVGTAYSPRGGGSGGSDQERRGHQDFAPGPPPDARHLYVGWRGQQIDIPLPPADADV
jgi:hypothetical protein